ncbi:MAG TPA: hypothetical protein PLB07_03020 [Bacteroidales bacterium]|jgi:hypothetical protein|nr:hypothetical protein [Bacteroidales bacterium]OPZ57804.1 MAG: hypothetical protein BWY89_00403 [Bacteroidetes bacterium ADurb.BinA012]HNV66206.1 hypothetical protein [Bacteroidales bacterium]HNY58105.1 hypothetical protein [Bacteroidales bacterium]HOC48187.1 hypothetical protein [Bacteroidales bacterium]
MSVSNLRIFLLFSLFTLLIISCDRDKNDVIPDITVDFTITSSDPEFFDLFNAPGTSALISSAHRHLGLGTAGFDGNGIIVYSTGLHGFEFPAFDRTCPHCYANNEVSVAVTVDGVYAICPECSTNYALGGSGLPQSGPGHYYLKNYRTSFSGYSIRVWNRR